MLTVWCLAVAFGSPWLVGAPVFWLARGGRALNPRDWCWVPFIGLGAIMCPLYTLAVYADLPLARTAPWFWAGVGMLWAGMLARPGGRASVRAVPRRVVLLSIAAYLAQGAGVVSSGVTGYRGNLLSDQFNYVVLAQFLTDVPYSTGWLDAADRPWLGVPLSLKQDRVCQSALHGFLAVTAGRDALPLFFPTICLCSALLVPAVRLLAPRFGLFGRRANGAALVAALLPGVTSVVADCYLAQALFVPALFAFTAAVLDAARRPRGLALAGALFLVGFSVYVEFTPLMVGVAGAVALAARAAGRISTARAVALVVVPVAFAVGNPSVCESVVTIAARAGKFGHQINLPLNLPTIFSRVWVDVVRVQGASAPAVAAAVSAFVLLAYALSSAGWVRWCAGAVRSRRGLAPAAAALSLMLLPVAVAALSPGSKYAIYKVLLTVSPLFAVGLFLCARGAGRVGLAPARWAALAVAAVTALNTVEYQKGNTGRSDVRGAAKVWNDRELQPVLEWLDHTPEARVVVSLGEGEEPEAWVAAGAILYHGQRHRIGLESPRRLWLGPSDGLIHMPPPAHVPAGTVVITRIGDKPVPGEPLVRSKRYAVVRIDADHAH